MIDKPIVRIILFTCLILGLSWYVFIKHAARDMSDISTAGMKNNLELTSSAFPDGGRIPKEYTCDGSGSVIPLSIHATPKEAKSLVLIFEDIDVPKVLRPSGVYDHYVLFNIPAITTEMSATSSPGTLGTNSSGTVGYVPPCPPPQYEPPEHRYIFTLYALDRKLPLQQGASKDDVLKEMNGAVVEMATISGLYSRK